MNNPQPSAVATIRKPAIMLVVGIALIFLWMKAMDLLLPVPLKLKTPKIPNLAEILAIQPPLPPSPMQVSTLVAGGTVAGFDSIVTETAPALITGGSITATEIAWRTRDLQGLVTGGAIQGATPLRNKVIPALVASSLVLDLDQIRRIVKPTQETVAMLGSGLISSVEPFLKLRLTGFLDESLELIPLGFADSPYNLQILLNTYGGSVQQVILTEFPGADREGLPIRDADGKPKPIALIPGTVRERTPTLRGQDKFPYPTLEPGFLSGGQRRILAMPTFVMFHYEKADRDNPVSTLGGKNWQVVERDLDPKADTHKVVFETTLRTEFHSLRIRKIFTLNRKDYHVGLKIEMQPLEPGVRHEPFRYQITGAHGLPIEGEWYTSPYRQAIIGLDDRKGTASREVMEAADIRQTEGTDRIRRDERKMLRFAAIRIQYFASVLAVDNEQIPGQKQDFLEFVRATPVGETTKVRQPKRGPDGKEEKDVPTKPFLDDITVRAITEALDADKPITHQYLLYQGPAKVRLLKEMPGSKAVDEGLVDRYLNSIHLRIITDAPMDNALGRFANAIWWSDLVIAFTNIIHTLLWLLNQFLPNYGICIFGITILVRGLLFPLSRRQAYNSAVMQQKMAKIAPDLKKLQEQYGNDFHRYNQEKMRLMKENGVSPFTAMGGCFLLLLQMPILTGLYFAMQESIFFRLEPFLWMPSLAAPDMLVFWGESIPWISNPDDLGHTLYLGPYLNILPLLTVSLMIYQQAKMMPKTDDPQMQAQQRMMKIMMVMMALFFYKSASGLCLYFIASTTWGLLERRFVPKIDPNKLADQGKEPLVPTAPKPLGWFGRRKARWKEKWLAVLEEAKKQQEHRRDPLPPSKAAPTAADRQAKKKKKRK